MHHHQSGGGQSRGNGGHHRSSTGSSSRGKSTSGGGRPSSSAAQAQAAAAASELFAHNLLAAQVAMAQQQQSSSSDRDGRDRDRSSGGGGSHHNNPLALLQQQMNAAILAQHHQQSQAQAQATLAALASAGGRDPSSGAAAAAAANASSYNNPAAAWWYLEYLSRIQAAQMVPNLQGAGSQGPGTQGQGSMDLAMAAMASTLGGALTTGERDQQQRDRERSISAGRNSSRGRGRSPSTVKPSSQIHKLLPQTHSSNSGSGRNSSSGLKLPSDTDLVRMPPFSNQQGHHSSSTSSLTGSRSSKPMSSATSIATLLPPGVTATTIPPPGSGSGGGGGGGGGQHFSGTKRPVPKSSSSSSLVIKLNSSREEASTGSSALNLTSSAGMKKSIEKSQGPNKQFIFDSTTVTPLKNSSPATSPLPLSASSGSRGSPPAAHAKPATLTTLPGKYADLTPKPAHSASSQPVLYSHVIQKHPQVGLFPSASGAVNPRAIIEGLQGGGSQLNSTSSNSSSSSMKKKKTTVASLLAQSRSSDFSVGLHGGQGQPLSLDQVKRSPTPHRPWMTEGPSMGPVKSEHPANEKISFKAERMTSSPASVPIPLNIPNVKRRSDNSDDTEQPSQAPADLTLPMKHGWRRETFLKGVGSQGLSGEVVYISPGRKQCRNVTEVKKWLAGGPLTVNNFSFSSRLLIGDFLIPMGCGGSFDRKTGNLLGQDITGSTGSSGTTLKLNSAQLAQWLSSENTAEDIENMRIQEIKAKEDRDRKKQHSVLIRALEMHRRSKRRVKLQMDRKMKKKAEHEAALEQLSNRHHNQSQNENPQEIEELTSNELKDLPDLKPIKGLKLSPVAFGNLLHIYEFLSTFGETLGFDMDSLPSVSNLQKAFLHVEENEEELLSVLSHLLVCAVEDPGMPNPNKHLTNFGQTLKQADITFGSLSEVLRLYLEGIADSEPEAGMYSQWLSDAPFQALAPSRKSGIVAFVCDILLQNKAVLKHLDSSTESAHGSKKERQQNDIKIRRLRMLCARKAVAMAASEVKKPESKPEEESSPSKDKDGEKEKGEEEGGSQTPTTEDGPAATAEFEETKDKPEETKVEVTEGSEPPPDDIKISFSRPLTPLNSIPLTPATPGANTPLTTTAIESDSSEETVGGGHMETESEQDAKLSIEEIRLKMNQLHAENEVLRHSMNESLRIIRSSSLGQDRWRRRYWNLPNAGGIFVEGGASGEFVELRKKVKERLAQLDAQVELAIENGIKMEIKDENDEEPMEVENTTEVKPEIKKEANEDLKSENEPETETESDKESLSKKCTEENGTAAIVNGHDDPSEKSSVPVVTNGHAVNGDLKSESSTPTTTGPTISTSELFEVPPPVIKIFSLAPRPPCSAKTKEVEENEGENGKEVEEQTDDDILVEKVRSDLWNDWWLLSNDIVEILCPKGVRERTVRTNLNTILGKDTSSSSHHGHHHQTVKEPEELDDEDIPVNCHSPVAGWDPELNYKVHLQLLETLETLEERVASASLQVKGWQLPAPRAEATSQACSLSEEGILEVVKDRLIDLESAIERRYLKPPLGKSANDLSISTIVGAQQAQAAKAGSSGSDQRNDRSSSDGAGNSDVDDTVNAKPQQGSRALAHWRDGIAKSITPGPLSMALYTLDSSIAWDKSVMKASCQLCKGGDHEDRLLLCDACDRGYHTYCFRPPLDNIPDGDWYCWECINKATGIKGCIVCGKGPSAGKLLACDKCVKAFHADCLNPPLAKVPRGRWHCPDHRKLSPVRKRKSNTSSSAANKETNMDDSTNESKSGSGQTSSSDKTSAAQSSESKKEKESAKEDKSSSQTAKEKDIGSNEGSKTPNEKSGNSTNAAPEKTAPAPSPPKPKINKKQRAEQLWCERLLGDLSGHEDAWPFLEPVNTRQFPTYKKVIKTPMDLQTIKGRLTTYKNREGFLNDVRMIFDNCETFNEDDSPVGKAGHSLRLFFEAKSVGHTGKGSHAKDKDKEKENSTVGGKESSNATSGCVQPMEVDGVGSE